MDKWSECFLDWVLLCSIFVLLATFIVDIVKSVKDKKSLSKEHDGLSKEHDGLSKEHDGLSKEHDGLSKEHNQLSKNLSKSLDFIISQNEQQKSVINSIDKELCSENKKRDEQFKNLSLSQKDAYKQLEAFTFLMNEVKRLQTENLELKKKLSDLLNQDKERQQVEDLHRNNKRRL